jgi:3-hydroxyisobutyrate dehydrogenase
MATKELTIGFVGVGAMGWPMAALLAGAGYRLVVVDADPARATRFADEHDVVAAATAREAAARADVLITILPNSAIVEEVLFGPDGAAATLSRDSVVVEMSSGIPAQTSSFAHRLAISGVSMIDAPVSGGVSRATTGELTIMVGGEPVVVDRVRDILNVLGTQIHLTGDLGSGQAMKALNNLTSATGLISALETLAIGRAQGLDPGQMVDILNVSTGMTNSTKLKLKQFVLSGAFNSGFGLDLLIKDVRIAVQMSDAAGIRTPLSSLTRDILDASGRYLGPGHDHTEVAKYVDASAAGEIS